MLRCRVVGTGSGDRVGLRSHFRVGVRHPRGPSPRRLYWPPIGRRPTVVGQPDEGRGRAIHGDAREPPSASHRGIDQEHLLREPRILSAPSPTLSIDSGLVALFVDRLEEKDARGTNDARLLRYLSQVRFFEEAIGSLGGREIDSDHEVVRVPDEPPHAVSGRSEPSSLRLMCVEDLPPGVGVRDDMVEHQQRGPLVSAGRVDY